MVMPILLNIVFYRVTKYKNAGWLKRKGEKIPRVHTLHCFWNTHLHSNLESRCFTDRLPKTVIKRSEILKLEHWQSSDYFLQGILPQVRPCIPHDLSGKRNQATHQRWRSLRELVSVARIK